MNKLNYAALMGNFVGDSNRSTRRNFLRGAILATLGFAGPLPLMAATDENWFRCQLPYFKGQDVLKRTAQKALKEKWKKRPIGDVIGKVALELAGTPWRPFTLDVSPSAEHCVVNLQGMDCFTFIENALCIARIIKRGKTSPEDLINEVQYTLYRDGKMGDFTTRLHYVSDWYFDNDKRGILKILTPDLPGAKPYKKRVDFMSTHPDRYKQLNYNSGLIAGIAAAEEAINARPMMYLPIDKLKDAEHLLQTGDLVCVTTTEPGLDIGHCGMCLKDAKSLFKN